MNVILFQLSLLAGLGCLISCPRGPPVLPISCPDVLYMPSLLGLHGRAHTPSQAQRPGDGAVHPRACCPGVGGRTGQRLLCCPGDIRTPRWLPRTATVSRARAGPGHCSSCPMWLSTLRNPPAIFGLAPKDLQGQIKVLKSIRATTATSSGCYLVFTGGGQSR